MGQILIESAPESLDSDTLRSKLNADGCGSIVSFLGLTRGIDDGIEVHHLEFDAWSEKLPDAVSYTHLRAHET